LERNHNGDKESSPQLPLVPEGLLSQPLQLQHGFRVSRLHWNICKVPVELRKHVYLT